MKKLIGAVVVLIIISAFENGAKINLEKRTKESQPNTVEVINQVDSLVSKIQLINKSNRNEK